MIPKNRVASRLELCRTRRILAVVSGSKTSNMKIKVVVHEAEEGGFWAEVPAIPGCATQGDTMDELMRNLHEAIEGCLAVDIAAPKPGDKQRILEIAV
jgi:predicted RNase H-like HicB family nuclease